MYCLLFSSLACVSVTVAECPGAACWCWPTVTPLFAPPSAACLMTPVQPSIYPCWQTQHMQPGRWPEPWARAGVGNPGPGQRAARWRSWCCQSRFQWKTQSGVCSNVAARITSYTKFHQAMSKIKLGPHQVWQGSAVNFSFIISHIIMFWCQNLCNTWFTLPVPEQYSFHYLNFFVIQTNNMHLFHKRIFILGLLSLI